MNASFVGSYAKAAQCPQLPLPEYALVGRSNVGKSSLLNYLCGHSSLAKVSQRPGKTQTINFFLLQNAWHLVDLPGYGYARLSKTLRATFQHMMVDYLNHRPQLMSVLLLIDASIPPQVIDLTVVQQLGAGGVPFVLVFTKADKEKPKLVQQHIHQFLDTLRPQWDTLPQHFITSAREHRGAEALLQFMQQTNTLYRP